MSRRWTRYFRLAAERRLMQADRQRSDHKPGCGADIALAAFGLVQLHRDAATMAARDLAHLAPA
jgi:hypothetical protein